MVPFSKMKLFISINPSGTFGLSGYGRIGLFDKLAQFGVILELFSDGQENLFEA